MHAVPFLRVWMTKHSRAWALNNFGWLKHPRAWALNIWTTRRSRAWALNKIWVRNRLELCISAYNSTTTTTTTTNMHNQLWHTPQLGQCDTTIHTTNSSTCRNSHKSIQSIYQEVFIRFSAYTEVIQYKINILECSDGSPNARNANQKVADKRPTHLSEGLLAWATSIT